MSGFAGRLRGMLQAGGASGAAVAELFAGDLEEEEETDVGADAPPAAGEDVAGETRG